MRGFTVIEILLVVVLMGIVAGIVVPSYHGPYQALVLKNTTDSAVSLMRYAQAQATLKHVPYQFNCDPDKHYFWLSRAVIDDQGEVSGVEAIADRMGRRVDVPHNVNLDCEHQEMVFLPDGTISKNKIKLSNNKKTFTVSSYEQRGYVLVYDD